MINFLIYIWLVYRYNILAQTIKFKRNGLKQCESDYSKEDWQNCQISMKIVNIYKIFLYWDYILFMGVHELILYICLS